MSVRFCLSYDPSEWDFIALKINILSIRERIVDTDVVNDVTYTRQSFITSVVIWFLWHGIIHWITASHIINHYFNDQFEINLKMGLNIDVYVTNVNACSI